MKKLIFTSIIALATVAGLNAQNVSVQAPANGLKIHKANKGERIKTDDFVKLHISYRTEKDSLLFDSHHQTGALTITVEQPSYKGDLMDVLRLLTVNDSATFYTNADSLFGKSFNSPVPHFIRPGSLIAFSVKIVEVMSPAQMEALTKAKNDSLSKSEKKERDAFLASNGKKYLSTPSGLMYVINKEGKGSIPANGSTVVVNYTGKLLNGTVFDSSVDREPIEFAIGTGQVIKGWDEGIALLKEGSSATFVIPSDLAYGEVGAGQGIIPPFATLIFDVELLSKAEIDAKKKAETESRIKSEEEQINAYIAAKNLKVVTTASGLRYAITLPASGAKPNVGNKVSVHYTGTLLNGNKFDSSVDRGSPFEFDLGKGRVIKGWDEGIALLNKGSKAIFIIPSALAYGERAMGADIPANSPLVFEVELVDFK